MIERGEHRVVLVTIPTGYAVVWSVRGNAVDVREFRREEDALRIARIPRIDLK